MSTVVSRTELAVKVRSNGLLIVEEIVAVTNDPALHTVQTVGRLSAVAARRVWANLAYKVNELRNSGKKLICSSNNVPIFK